MILKEIDKAKYSILAICNDKLDLKDFTELHRLLVNGNKVILILNKNSNFSNMINDTQNRLDKAVRDFFTYDYKEFEKYQLFQVHYAPIEDKFTNLCIVDGQVDKQCKDDLKNILDLIPSFNFEQFMVEHMDSDSNIAVEAGAGSGKTKVMVDRILYLLHVNDSLDLNDISMITFTRQATQNMKHKLQRELLIRYKLTKKDQYLKYLETQSHMKILTIPAFAKHMTSQLGAIVGYGKDVRIRGFEFERKNLINEILNEYFKENQHNSGVFDMFKTSLYDFVKIIDSFWDKVENEGVSYNEIENFDWGQPSNPGSTSLQLIMKEIFIKLERNFQNIKRKENAISLKDISRELDNIKGYVSKVDEKLSPIKYLFVDEFQDTDNTQIELVSWLHKELDTRLFVVGDIKQSIYRFRGATYTAFSELDKKLKNNIRTKSLIKNYRTSSAILNELHPMFVSWNSRGLLLYENSDVLSPINVEDGEFVLEQVSNKEAELKVKTLELINEAKDNLDKYLSVKQKRKVDYIRENHQKVAVLVRTNSQAAKIKDWCKESGIPCYVEVGGTFFTSQAVRDFQSLISAFVYQNEAIYKLNLIASSYSRVSLGWRDIYDERINESEKNDILEKLLDEDKWNYYKESFRIKPVLSVIRELIEDINPASNYYQIRKQELKENPNYKGISYEAQAKLDGIQYYKNLNYLMELLRNNFSSDFLSLYKIHNYLKNQIPTNRKVDEVRLDDNEIGDAIHCMTVHKSKGLEFDTVIIPFTNRKFRYGNINEILVGVHEDKNKVGWSIYKKKGNTIENYSNTYYKEFESYEETEVVKEEARLLYVALTRSIRRLVCIKSNDKKNTWGNLLIKGNENGK